MKYGFYWDRYKKELKLSQPLAYLVIFENVCVVLSIIIGLFSQFLGK